MHSFVPSHGHAAQSRGLSYHEAFGDLLEGCSLVDLEWRYVYVNESAAKHARRPIDELLGRTMMEAFPGLEGTPLFAALRRCARERSRTRFETEIVYGDGTSTWLELSVQPRPEGLFILSIDVTERKRAEEALRSARDHLGAVFEARKVPIVAVDLDGHVTLWSKAAERLFGWTESEVIGRPAPMVPAHKQGQVEELRRAARRGGRTLDNFPTERCDRSGRLIPVSLSTAYLRGPTGETIGVVLVLVDVTEQTKLRTALAQSEERFRATFESSPIAKLLVRRDDRLIVEVNRACLQLFARSRGDVVGAPAEVVLPRESVVDRLWEGVAHGTRADEIEFAFPAGGAHVEATATAERIVVDETDYLLVSSRTSASGGERRPRCARATNDSVTSPRTSARCSG